jgi:cytochrome P450
MASALPVRCPFYSPFQRSPLITYQATVYHLLRHPVKHQNFAKKIRYTFEIEEDITPTNVNGPKYLNAVINGSLRLTPPVPGTTRRITDPRGNAICGEHIPAGVCSASSPNLTSLLLLTQSLDPSWSVPPCRRTLRPAWKAVESFVPERWLGDKEYESHNLAHFSPFASGPRNCIGQK